MGMGWALFIAMFCVENEDPIIVLWLIYLIFYMQ